jgi:hypothetical protein
MALKFVQNSINIDIEYMCNPATFLLYRYPFIASEVFNCELNKINDMFFSSKAEEEAESSKESSARKGNENNDKKNKASVEIDEEEDIIEKASPKKPKESEEEDDDELERINPGDEAEIELSLEDDDNFEVAFGEDNPLRGEAILHQKNTDESK